MKMKINFTDKMLKDTFYSLTPVNLLLRSTGLSNIYRKGTQLAESGSIVKSLTYIIIGAIINIVVLYYKLRTFQGSRKNGIFIFSDAIQLTYWLGFLEYIIDIYFVYKNGRDLHLKYFTKYDHIDALLGVPCYDKIRKTMVKSIAISMIMFLFNFILDYVVWYAMEGWYRPTVYSIDYLYFFLNMFTVLDYICHIIQVEYRLKMMHNFLQDCKIEINNPINNINEIDGPPPDTALKNSLNSLKTLSYTRYLDTTWFSKCYLPLLKQATYINTSYGLRIMMYCINLIINVISLLNLGIRVMDGTMVPAGGKHDFFDITPLYIVLLITITTITRALSYEIMAMILIYRCEQIYRQSESILETVDELLASSENHCKGLKTNLLQIRNLLITRPIKFHAGHFFTTDYSLWVSLNSAVMTYTIIMLQNMQ